MYPIFFLGLSVGAIKARMIFTLLNKILVVFLYTPSHDRFLNISPDELHHLDLGKLHNISI
jgi:hypothetical protein